MLLGKRFEKFVEQSPVSVMVRGTLERIFQPERLEQLFEQHAVLQYTKELTFTQCVSVMSDVVLQVSPTVGAWYQAHPDELSVTRQALYDKLRHLELPLSVALVQYAGREMLDVLQRMKAPPPEPLPGYRLRVLDGNHLAGTEHRIGELRPYRAAPLPGQALVFYDVRFDLLTDVIPCEDAYAQERSLLDQALALIAARDCVLADRNFCTLGFLFGLDERRAKFVIRQHGSLPVTELSRRRRVGQDTRGRKLYEQPVRLTNAAGATLVLRRITIALDQPTKDGETELHLLTNLPDQVRAAKVADLYAERWTIERAFWHLSEELQSEINTLGYPRAALFGFCVALTAYNVVSLVKGTIRAVWGAEFVRDKLSMYYLALEVSQVTPGMLIALPDPAWQEFARQSPAAFAKTLCSLAKEMDLRKYTKAKRGPKKPPKKKISGKRNHHISTARLLALRT
jgi:IS4 transposase